MKSTARRSIEFQFHRSIDHHDVLFPWDERPFISMMDVEEEYLTISNPWNTDVSLQGYRLVDAKGLHAWTFDANNIIPANSMLYVYTCPGGSHNIRFQEPNVLWTNNDGSLRRKEALHNRK
jgi:hypothetical protein